jgi:hypothetical protein
VVDASAISAVWHVPFQLFGIQHIDGVSPVTLALTVPFAIFGMGLVIGSLWLKTESIWIVTLAHDRSTSGDSTPSSTWSSSGPRTRSWEAPVSSRLSSSGPCCCGWARGRASARPTQHEREAHGRPKRNISYHPPWERWPGKACSVRFRVIYPARRIGRVGRGCIVRFSGEEGNALLPFCPYSPSCREGKFSEVQMQDRA